MAASIACTPQDMKFKGEVTTAEIGDYNEIREYVTISRGTASQGKTVVGSYNLVMAYAHIAHDCVVGDHNVIVNRVSLGGEVHIGNWVVIGGHTAVHQWVRIGDHAMVQGMSGVTKDIPPFITTSNKDYYAGINKIGLSRRGFTPEQITAVHEACRILFQSNLNYYGGIVTVSRQSLPPSAERDMLVQFIRSSKRGLHQAIRIGCRLRAPRRQNDNTGANAKRRAINRCPPFYMPRDENRNRGTNGYETIKKLCFSYNNSLAYRFFSLLLQRCQQ